MSRSLIALVLPGGTDVSNQPFSRVQPSALRMYPFTWALRARFPRSVVTRQVAYRVRGWNGAEQSPLGLARSALQEATHDYPNTPIVVIGHSLGGRVAAHLAADPRVIGVLALAPWWENADHRLIGASARVVALHGSADTRTSPLVTQTAVDELVARGMDAEFVHVPDGKHAMLDHIGTWQRAAIDFVAERLDVI